MVSFEPLQNLLNKEMDRKEFIKHVGAILITLVGISALVRAISNPMSDVKTMPKQQSKTPSGYGSKGAYGV